MFDETLVIWGGEFGRTIYSQGGLTKRTTAAIIIRAASRCGWPAAASRPGTIYGETDDFSLQHRQRPGARPPISRHRAALLGFDHERFTFRYQGLDQKLTGVEPARVVERTLT